MNNNHLYDIVESVWALESDTPGSESQLFHLLLPERTWAC